MVYKITKLLKISDKYYILTKKNGRESFDNLPFCTQDNSVLEPFYKDLVLLYELRIPLKKEGLSNYPINPYFLREKQVNTILQ